MKLRRIAAALVIVSLGAASIAFGSMYAKMRTAGLQRKRSSATRRLPRV